MTVARRWRLAIHCDDLGLGPLRQLRLPRRYGTAEAGVDSARPDPL